jgi:hypothetical protein
MSCQDECLQHPQFVDMTGRKFGRLLILGLGEKRGSRLLWRVRCDCGTEKQSGGGDIRSGKIISCGCWKPDNCRWATNVEQARNSKSARLVTIAGKTKCVTEWLVDIGLSDTAYQSRRHRGWDDARALTTPPDQRFNWHKRSRT